MRTRVCVCAMAGWVADQSFEHAVITMFFTGGKLSAQNLVYLDLYRCERCATCCLKKTKNSLDPLGVFRCHTLRFVL